VNLADEFAQFNSTKGMPPIMQELRQATNQLILEQARKLGQCAVKFVVGSNPVRPKISGYATFLSFVQGSSPAELEAKLGFKPGVLQAHGAYMYQVDVLALNSGIIAPRGNSDWPGGITPRDLYNLSLKNRSAVHYSPNYPPATQPIPQFVILQEVPYIGPPRFIHPDGVV
jgi:hypothetical protein